MCLLNFLHCTVGQLHENLPLPPLCEVFLFCQVAKWLWSLMFVHTAFWMSTERPMLLLLEWFFLLFWTDMTCLQSGSLLMSIIVSHRDHVEKWQVALVTVVLQVAMNSHDSPSSPLMSGLHMFWWWTRTEILARHALTCAVEGGWCPPSAQL